MKLLFHLGRYSRLLAKVFAKPEKKRIYFRQFLIELDRLGLDSVGIVFIISIFMGAVITIQTGLNLENPFIPLYLIGYGTRDSMILEFSSTIVSLILAGKVGSNIASEIGTMRVTEQIDALEIMGVNSASYLILPKILAAVFINPFLVILSIFIGIWGGWLGGCVLTDVLTTDAYIVGLRYAFVPFYITYSLFKTVVFAFIITSVSAYMGYFTEGGALEVGRSSTKAVVYSSVLILMFNLILTQLLLA
ncbi:MAG: ABC transporter permease [Bacteroidales bacterium]|nr:ABC transporter permease [Bacteroidales bacterium]MCF8455966.1 ABC transporter permease [Bacteroidales bacterium]